MGTPLAVSFSQISSQSVFWLRHFLQINRTWISSLKQTVGFRAQYKASLLRVLSAGWVLRADWVEGDGWRILSWQQKPDSQQSKTESSAWITENTCLVQLKENMCVRACIYNCFPFKKEVYTKWICKWCFFQYEFCLYKCLNSRNRGKMSHYYSVLDIFYWSA